MPLILCSLGALLMPFAIVALLWMFVATNVPTPPAMPVSGYTALGLAALCIALLAVSVIGLQQEYRRRMAHKAQGGVSRAD